MKHSTSKNAEKREERNKLIIKAHQLYLESAQAIANKAEEALIAISLTDTDIITKLKIDGLVKSQIS